MGYIMKTWISIMVMWVFVGILFLTDGLVETIAIVLWGVSVVTAVYFMVMAVRKEM